jgi:ankyrin repeat protein
LYTNQNKLEGYNILNGSSIELFTKLENIIQSGNFKELEQLFLEKSITQIDLNEGIVEAASCSNLEMVKFLKEKGANLQEVGNRALNSAIYEENLEIMQFFINNGVDINYGNGEYLRNTLQFQHIKIETIRFLLDAGVSVQNCGIFLTIAAKNGRNDIVSLVLQYFNQYPPEIMLIVNTALGYTEKVEKSIKNDVDIHINNEEALKLACSKGNIEIIKLFLDNGADIHVNEDEPISIAATNGHTEAVKLVLKAGANIHAKNDACFKSASKSQHLALVQFLLNGDFDFPNEILLLGFSNLGDITQIRKLLQKGIDIHIEEESALLNAVRGNHLELVRFLLENGANIHAQQNIAFNYARNNKPMINLLQEFSINSNE